MKTVSSSRIQFLFLKANNLDFPRSLCATIWHAPTAQGPGSCWVTLWILESVEFSPDWGVRITGQGVLMSAQLLMWWHCWVTLLSCSLQDWTSYNLHLHGWGCHFKCDWFRLKNVKTRSLLRAAGIPELQWLLKAVAHPAVPRPGCTSSCCLQELVSLQLTEVSMEFPNLPLP